MRVNQANSAPIQNADTAASKKAELKKAGYEVEKKSTATTTKSDSVNAEISSKAHDMAKAKQIASDTSDVREAKIAELKEKIQNKKYDVSASAIADKLVDDHIRMTGA
jgi:flagellar biosynthesis anti-sigma factor FlgM